MVDVIQFPKINDRKLIICFEELCKQLAFTLTSFQLVGGQISGALAWDNPEIQKIHSMNFFIIKYIAIQKNGANLSYYRNGSGSDGRVKSAFIDEIQFPNPNAFGNELIPILSIINKHIMPLESEQYLGKGTEEQLKLEAIHNSVLTRLEQVNADVIEKSEKFREFLEQTLEDKKGKLENEHVRIISKLEADFLKKEEKLNQDRLALEKEKEELDSQSNTHARRQKQKDLLAEIKSRQEHFTLTTDTQNLRNPVQKFALGLILIGLGLTIFYSVEQYRAISNNQNLWTILIIALRQTLSIGIVVGTMIYMIRWHNNWFDQHAQTEFQIRQFGLDMERASWLVETSLEWKEDNSEKIPTELLKGLSNGLFSPGPKQDTIKHPIETLESLLLSSATGIKLRLGENEIQLDPKILAKRKELGNN